MCQLFQINSTVNCNGKCTGSVLTEFIVCLPLLFLIVAGAIDLSAALTQGAEAARALRFGARRTLLNGADYEVAADTGAFQVCSEVHEAVPGDDVGALAIFSTCMFIDDSGLDPGDWKIKAQPGERVAAQGIEFNSVKVEVVNEHACFWCVGGLQDLKPREELIFLYRRASGLEGLSGAEAG